MSERKLPPDVQVGYVEMPLDDVMDYFIRGYRPNDGVLIVDTKWFMDPVKRVVILKLFVKPTQSKVVSLKE